ncbi:Formamidase [Pleurotus pulmonarius]
MSIHSVKRQQNHLAWDKSIQPIVYVQSGEAVTFDCLDASNGQITPTSTASTISSLVFSQLDQVSGPVHVEGALPGDTLQVDVLKIETATWGWTGVIPGFGLLHDEFSEPALKIWELDTKNGFAWFDREKGIKIPLRPFPGEMGVAPGKDGAFSTIPPYNTGGNLDTKYLRAGSTLYLPIEAEGGLFSIGDGHAAQGDGEVCGTAIETPIQVTVRLTEEYYCTTGIDANIEAATKAAVRYMIDYLVAEHQLDRTEAYMLCSVAGDLRLHEVVDMPNYVVGMMIPKSIFTLAI